MSSPFRFFWSAGLCSASARACSSSTAALDPPVAPILTSLKSDEALPANVAIATANETAGVAAGPVQASIIDTTGSVSGKLTAAWSSSTNHRSRLSRAPCRAATVTDSSGHVVGTGSVALSVDGAGFRGDLRKRPVQGRWHRQPHLLRPVGRHTRHQRRLAERFGYRHGRPGHSIDDRRARAQRPSTSRRNLHDHRFVRSRSPAAGQAHRPASPNRCRSAPTVPQSNLGPEPAA